MHLAPQDGSSSISTIPLPQAGLREAHTSLEIMSGKRKKAAQLPGKSGAVRARKALSTGSPGSSLSPAPSLLSSPVIPLGITSHPYILQQVINEASPSVLAALLQCSKHIFQLAAPALYRHPHMTGAQFKGMIDAGYGPVKQGSTSGMLGRSFSPFLREAMRHVLSLHIIDFDSKIPVPVSIPRDAFSALKSVTLHASGDKRKTRSIEVPPGLLAVKPSQLSIRFSHAQDIPSTTGDVGMYSTYPGIRQFQTLLPSNWRPQGVPSSYYGTHWGWGGRNSIPTPVTVVIYPSRLPSTGPAYLPVPAPSHGWRHWNPQPLRFVGGEYYGLYNSGRPIIESIVAARESRKVTYSRFVDWLDEQEPGVVFSPSEEAELREIDRELIAECEANATEAPTAA